MDTVVNLQPIVDILWQIAGLVGVVVAGVFARWLNQKTIAGKIFSEDDMRTRLEQVVLNGIAYANSKINKPFTIDVKNQIVKMATDYAVAYAPGTLKSLKASPEDIAARVEAELAKILGLNDPEKILPAA